MGTTCWKVLDVRADDPAPTISRELRDRSADAPCFFFAKIPTRDVGALANATQAGFSVVDVNVTFDWLATANSIVRQDAPGNGLSFGVAEREDAPGIEEIAAHCFTYSRFHLDPKIQVSVANLISRPCRGNLRRPAARQCGRLSRGS
jgi:hypothetical protein